MLPHTRQSGETMISVSASHIILTLTQTVESGPQQGLNPGPPHQESRALPTELQLPSGFMKGKMIKDLNAKTFSPTLLGIVDTFIFQLMLSNPLEHKHFV